MNDSEPDYAKPSVVQINSIALGLIGCFLLTLVIVWWLGRGGTAEGEIVPPTPTEFGRSIVTPPAGIDISAEFEHADAKSGALLYQELGCAKCHALDGRILIGPPLDSIRERIPEGTRSTKDYLTIAILDPAASVRDGFANIMPSNYAEMLSKQDVADLIAFLLEN